MTEREYAAIYRLLLSSPSTFTETEAAFIHFCGIIYQKDLLAGTPRVTDARNVKAGDSFGPIG